LIQEKPNFLPRYTFPQLKLFYGQGSTADPLESLQHSQDLLAGFKERQGGGKSRRKRNERYKRGKEGRGEAGMGSDGKRCA